MANNSAEEMEKQLFDAVKVLAPQDL